MTLKNKDESFSVDSRGLSVSDGDLERDLCYRILDGDEAAVDELAIIYLGYVKKVAYRYAKIWHLPVEDFVQEGYLNGLRRAAQKYDVRKGYKFLTYAAWWVENAMISYLRDKGYIIRMPNYIWDEIMRIKKMETRSLMERNAVLTDDQILANVSCPGKGKVESIRIDMNLRVSSLFAPIGGGVNPDKKRTLMDVISDDSVNNSEELIARADLKEAIVQLQKMAGLSAQEKRILALIFGMEGENEHSYSEIDRVTGINRFKVKEIKDRALRKLRLAAKVAI